MLVIKNEKKVYLENGRTFLWGNIQFLLPQWWTLKEEKTDSLTFHRSDTRYDWNSNFRWVESDKDLKEIFKAQFSEREILFDQETDITESAIAFFSSSFQHQLSEALRIEGMATKAGEERIYIDALILKFKDQGKVLYMESYSSVLNGMVEGPFFEEVFKNLEWT